MRDNILRVTEAVEDKVAQEMPDNFGIIFDGWSNDSEHYLAAFATYEVDGLVKTPLQSMAPIVNEPDDNLKAESHRSAWKSDPPHERTAVGCASHRLNLAVRLITADFQAELDLMQKVMVRLRTLSQAAKLRFKTHLRPVLRQDTRWSSTFCMPGRFFEIREHLDADNEAIEDLLPSPSSTKKLKALLVKMKMVESVSKRIQSSDVTIWERGRPLGRQEKTALSVLKVASGRPSADNPDDGFAERVLQRACVSEQTDKYILAVSMARAMIGLERHSLQMIMVEAKLFLKVKCLLLGRECCSRRLRNRVTLALHALLVHN
ncbi:Ribonuclease H-like domain [Phytophthora cactorum]|nr:Ribonuclease H-like domain [Phytophthora cactorum]